MRLFRWNNWKYLGGTGEAFGWKDKSMFQEIVEYLGGKVGVTGWKGRSIWVETVGVPRWKRWEYLSTKGGAFGWKGGCI